MRFFWLIILFSNSQNIYDNYQEVYILFPNTLPIMLKVKKYNIYYYNVNRNRFETYVRHKNITKKLSVIL